MKNPAQKLGCGFTGVLFLVVFVSCCCFLPQAQADSPPSFCPSENHATSLPTSSDPFLCPCLKFSGIKPENILPFKIDITKALAATVYFQISWEGWNDSNMPLIASLANFPSSPLLYLKNSILQI